MTVKYAMSPQAGPSPLTENSAGELCTVLCFQPLDTPRILCFHQRFQQQPQCTLHRPALQIKISMYY